MGNRFSNVISDTENFSHDADKKEIKLLKDVKWGAGGLGFEGMDFIELLDGYTFDGNNKIIDLEALPVFGLFSSKAESFNTAVVVKNLGVVGGNTLLHGGFIMRTGCTFFIIEKCYSTGLISGVPSGGIAGSSIGNFGKCIIRECYSTGDITGRDCGGIVGDYAGERDGECIIENCYSTGNISGQEAGGIAGGFASGNGVNDTSGICTVTNCFTTGNVTGIDAGGIAGKKEESNPGIMTVSNCYSSRTSTDYGGSDTIVFNSTAFDFIDGYKLASSLVGTLDNLPNDKFKSVDGEYPIMKFKYDLLNPIGHHCLLGSTMIDTDQGIIPICKVDRSMKILTSDGSYQKIQNIGIIKDYEGHLCEIKRHSIEHNVPNQNVYITQQHRIYHTKSDVWIFARFLSSRITKFEKPVDLYHIKLENNEYPFYANGLIVESLGQKYFPKKRNLLKNLK